MAEKHVIKLSIIMQFFKDKEKLISRGENAFESGHVINMTFDDDLKILIGLVQASMRDRQYKVEIRFDSDWIIKSAYCTCPRGELRCHHMASLAIFGHYNASVTDKACSWTTKKSVKEDIKKMKDIHPPKVHRSTNRDVSEDEIDELRRKLEVFEGAVGFTWLLMKEDPIEERILVDIKDVLFCEEYFSSENKQEYFKEKVKVSQDIVNAVAKLTVGQSRNKKWLVCRKNRLTASNFGMVLSACRRNRYPPSLFKNLAGTYYLDHIKAIQWGRAHDEDAITALENSLNLKVTPTGLWRHECGYLGASPDGLVGEDALVEVKCPFKYRESSLLEGIKQNRDYILIADSDGIVCVNKNHEYYYQIQGELALTKRSTCHLVVWTPLEVIIMEVKAEDFSENIEILRQFYVNHYIEFLVGGKNVS